MYHYVLYGQHVVEQVCQKRLGPPFLQYVNCFDNLRVLSTEEVELDTPWALARHWIPLVEQQICILNLAHALTYKIVAILDLWIRPDQPTCKMTKEDKLYWHGELIFFNYYDIHFKSVNYCAIVCWHFRRFHCLHQRRR